MVDTVREGIRWSWLRVGLVNQLEGLCSNSWLLVERVGSKVTHGERVDV